MEGLALVHVESNHFREFSKKLGRLDLGRGAGVTNVRPIFRVYSGARGGHDEFHVIVFVEGRDVTHLREIFGNLEAVGCHIDGYGG